jgi:hypothetical protein
MILNDSRELPRDHTFHQKSEYFDLARTPVRRLESEHRQLRRDQNKITDRESAEWKSLNLKIQKVYKQIAEARANATKVRKTLFLSV